MPLLALSIHADVRNLERSLDALARKQLPFATSQAANRLAFQAINDLRAKEQTVFDRPTPWTLNGFEVVKGKKTSPGAEIRAKDFATKGTPAWKYLTPETFGGSRRMKRFELALKAVFGTGYTTFGRGARLNRYGNISEADVVKLLSALGAFSEVGFSANRTARSHRRATRAGRRQETYFLAHSKQDGTPLAIYRVVSSGHVEPVLVFPKKKPSYSERLPYDATMRESITRHAAAFLKEEFAKAMATAK
ncbi:MAG TPA: hypothetical protein VGG10_15090 [Rhizomicrobium sp.]